MTRLAPRIKLCVSVDRPVALHPRHPLFKATDVLVIKEPEILRQIGNPSYRPSDLSRRASRNIAEAVNSGQPLTYHAEGIIEDNFIEKFVSPQPDSNNKNVLQLLEEKRIPYSSFHIGTSNTRVTKTENHWFGEAATNLASNADYRTFLLRFMPRFEARLGMIQTYYSGMLAFENMCYTPGRHVTDYICETRLINEVFSSFPKIYFLLDVAHAQVTAHWLKIDVIQYLASLPLHRVIEMHLCRPSPTGVDAHDLPEEQEYALVEFAFRKGARPEYLTIEYSKNTENLLGAYRKLRKLIA